MPVGPVTLCPVNARKSASTACTSTGSCGAACEASTHDDGADLVGASGDLGDRVDRAEHVGDPGQRDDLGALGDQLVDVGQVEVTVVGEPEPAQLGALALGEQLPRDDVGVVLHLGDHHAVAGPTCERAGPGERVGHEVERLGGVLGEDHLVARGRVQEPRDLVAGVLERRRRLRAELVHRARHVGVVPLEVVDHRVDDHLRLLRGVGAVEVDQRQVTAESSLEDREVLADDFELRQQPG